MSSLSSYQQKGTAIFLIDPEEHEPLRTVNSYLVRHADGLYLVDAGWNNESCWEAFLKVMKQLHYEITDLQGVILTHHHPDHVGLVHRIRMMHQDVKVFAHPLAVPYITQDQSFLQRRIAFLEKLYADMDGMPEAELQVEKFRRSLAENEAYRIEGDITLIQEGDTLLDFKVLDVPGHAPDHIMLYDPERKWALIGDLVIEHMSTNAIIEPDEQGNLLPTVTQQLASLKRCLSLDAEILFTGHGRVIHAPRDVILSKIMRIEHKLERMHRFIRDGYDTAGRIAREFYKDSLHSQFFLVISEVIGMLDHLERAGQIARHQINGIYHYAIIEEEQV